MTVGMVQIVQRLSPGGIETLALGLAARLPGRNPVLSLEGSTAELIAAWPALAEAPGPILGLEKPPGVSPAFVLRLALRLRALAPRAVVAHHIGPLLYGAVAARLACVPVVAYVEHDIWHYQAARDRKLTRVIGGLVNPQVVAISRGVADHVSTIMPGARIRIIRNAVDTDRFVPGDQGRARARLGLPPSVTAETFLVGTVGRLEHVKGHDVLIDAMEMLPGVHLAIVGHGSQAQALQTRSTLLGLNDRVHFLGHRSDMEQVYPAFDVLCLPSRNEGLPLAMLEAQACNVPVVASDVGSAFEGLCPGTGAIVQPDEPDELADILMEVLEQPGGPKLRAFVLDNFSWARMVGAYQDLVDARP